MNNILDSGWVIQSVSTSVLVQMAHTHFIHNILPQIIKTQSSHPYKPLQTTIYVR